MQAGVPGEWTPAWQGHPLCSLHLGARSVHQTEVTQHMGVVPGWDGQVQPFAHSSRGLRLLDLEPLVGGGDTAS